MFWKKHMRWFSNFYWEYVAARIPGTRSIVTICKLGVQHRQWNITSLQWHIINEWQIYHAVDRSWNGINTMKELIMAKLCSDTGFLISILTLLTSFGFHLSFFWLARRSFSRAFRSLLFDFPFSHQPISPPKKKVLSLLRLIVPKYLTSHG